jgi:hypothetical protein
MVPASSKVGILFRHAAPTVLLLVTSMTVAAVDKPVIDDRLPMICHASGLAPSP